jgi:hypothetical protein
MPRGMPKKTRPLTRPIPARQDASCPRQGRSKRRGEEVRTALRVGRSPFEWIVVNGKSPPVIPISESLSSIRLASERSENVAWGRARLGAPGSGG